MFESLGIKLNKKGVSFAFYRQYERDWVCIERNLMKFNSIEPVACKQIEIMLGHSTLSDKTLSDNLR